MSAVVNHSAEKFLLSRKVGMPYTVDEELATMTGALRLVCAHPLPSCGKGELFVALAPFGTSL